MLDPPELAGYVVNAYRQQTDRMLPLPDDIDELKRMLRTLHTRHQALDAEKQALAQENQAQAEEIQALKARLEQVLEQLNLSRAKRFGSQSEKAPKGTFNEAEQCQPKTEPQPQRKGRQPLPPHLEREVQTYVLAQPRCDCCGHELHVCGVEESEQLKIIPAKISVIKHRQTKYACRQCEQTAERCQVVTAPKPAQPFPQSLASPEALAAVVTAKYCDALPLYRQADILARGGLDISRSTLASWCIRASELVEPLRQAMQQHLLQQGVVCADETRVQVLDEPERAATAQSYMWVYRSSQFSQQPVVLYDYQPGRGHEHPAAFLKDYVGYLQCDGYQAYGSLKGVTLSCCWAHARRKFNDALLAQPNKTGKARQALSCIQKLYAIEQQVKALPAEQRRQVRLEKAAPILAEFKTWLEESKAQLTPKSYVGDAVNYVLNRWEGLCRYLDSGELGIDNNVTERDIRPFTTGRKNWLFSKSVSGAKASASLYGLVMTCRANDINPYYYFQQLFRELPQRGKGACLDDLLPWNIKLEAE